MDNTASFPTRRAGARAAWAAALALATLGALAAPAEAALWKWTDANGHVVYSDIPPSGDVKAERVNGPSAPVNPNAAKDMANKEAEFKKRQLQRTEDAAKADKASAEAARRQENCGQARGQIKALGMDDVQHVRVNERGERVVMDAATRKAEIDRLQAFVHSQCEASR